jgi:FtsZ-interacting cell division protein YlmF
VGSKVQIFLGPLDHLGDQIFLAGPDNFIVERSAKHETSSYTP